MKIKRQQPELTTATGRVECDIAILFFEIYIFRLTTISHLSNAHAGAHTRKNQCFQGVDASNTKYCM